MMTNRPLGVLYVGVTANRGMRVGQHRDGTGSAFCRRYRLTRLVLAEWHESMDDAIRREKMLKEWRRAWKIDLIKASNPQWRDLWDEIVGG